MISKKNISILLLISLFLSCDNINPDLEEGLYAKIETNKGSIILKLAVKEAPVTVANFVSLSEGDNPRVNEEFKSKIFYDGLKFDRVLFDNMSNKNLKLGVKLVKKNYETEASGNISLKTIKSVAKTGVNRVSVGSITHSAPAIDFKLEF